MNIICGQIDIEWENKEANLSRVESFLSRQSWEADSWLVLPEMFSTGFSMNGSFIEEPEGGSTESFLKNLAVKHRLNFIAGLVVSGAQGKPANQAVVISSLGLVLGRYSKTHLFTPAGEAESFSPGPGPLIVDVCGWKISPVICYDLRFPELFRSAAGQGANLFVVIASWPSLRRTHWICLAQARAIENQAYVVAVNRCGKDPNFEFAGDSMVIDPKGEIIYQAGAKETFSSVALDLEKVRQWRDQFPALKDSKAGLAT